MPTRMVCPSCDRAIHVPAKSDRCPNCGARLPTTGDAIGAGGVTEEVSGKQVSKGVGLELVDGPRGKAFRLTHNSMSASPCALNLNRPVDGLRVAAGQPFTLAFWSRRAHGDPPPG